MAAPPSEPIDTGVTTMEDSAIDGTGVTVSPHALGSQFRQACERKFFLDSLPRGWSAVAEARAVGRRRAKATEDAWNARGLAFEAALDERLAAGQRAGHYVYARGGAALDVLATLSEPAVLSQLVLSLSPAEREGRAHLGRLGVCKPDFVLADWDAVCTQPTPLRGCC